MRKNSTLIYSLNNLDESGSYIFNIDSKNPFGIEEFDVIEEYLNSKLTNVSAEVIENLIEYSKSGIV